MSIRHLIIAFLIAIGLTSSATSAAFSQGRMAGGQSITICSPDGTHEIILGANGQPVPGEHECEDCCFISLDAQDTSSHSSSSSQTLSRITLPMTEIAWLTRATKTANARAPPLVV